VIEALLCQGQAALDSDLATEAALRIAPFIARGLANLQRGVLNIEPGGLPYARTIAALFDPYRQDSLRRFSSAV
jgi:oxygen-independent coproporphyrinogen III oxidase